MKPELHIFGITIPTFGLMVSIGVLCFALIILTLFRKNHISEKKIDKLIIVCGLAGAIFALSSLNWPEWLKRRDLCIFFLKTSFMCFNT